MAVTTEVIAAWITGGAVFLAALIAGPIMWTLRKFDQRNTRQHDEAVQERRRNTDLLHHVAQKVDDSHTMLTEHLAWHAHHERPGGRRNYDRPEQPVSESQPQQ